MYRLLILFPLLVALSAFGDTPPPVSILQMKAGTCSGFVQGSAGALSCAIVVGLTQGGTGQITANASLNALLPSQSGNATKVLQTDGTNTSWVTASSGSGTVTTVSVVTANGLAGTVSNPTTTPAITLTVPETGILKSNGTAISAATSGTDYVIPSGSITGTATNITASSNSTLTTLSSLSLPYGQLSGTAPTWNQNTTGTAANITATTNSTLTNLPNIGSVGNIAFGQWLGTAISLNHGGTGQITVPAARGSSGLNIDQRSTFSNAAYTVLSTDRYVAQIGTLTGPQVVTLPAASALNPGQTLFIADESGSATSVNRLTITAAGSDTINGTATKTIKSAFGFAQLVSNGTNGWLTGVQEIGRGGTGLSSVPTDGQLLIGNTSAGTYNLGTITAGTNVTVTNSGGGITIAASGGGGSGTVTSVNEADGSTTPIYTLTGGPITTSGTLTQTLNTQTDNQIFAGPTSGSAAQPTFRSLTVADMPTSIIPNSSYFFGTGANGNVTCNGPITLTTDMFYNNLTLTTGCVLKPASFRIFVSSILDISNAPTGAIQMTGGTGGNGGVTGAGGLAGTAVATGSGIFTSTAGAVGSAGGTTAGTAGGTSGTGNGVEGGGSAASGAGGAGTGGAGGASGAGIVPLVPVSIRKFDTVFFGLVAGAFTPFRGGGGSASGGGGGGGTTTTGGGGGGGGPTGGIIYISAATIARGTNTNTGIIQSKGGNGGNGGTPTGANAGGGGGGSGGAGGWIFLAWGSLTGSTITGAVDVSGGAGGNGGNASTGGVAGGAGGGAGGSGRASMIDLTAGVSTETIITNGVSGSAQSAGVGGAGASAQVMQVNL